MSSVSSVNTLVHERGPDDQDHISVLGTERSVADSDSQAGSSDQMPPYPEDSDGHPSGARSLREIETRVQGYCTEAYELQEDGVELLPVENNTTPSRWRWSLNGWWTLELISEGLAVAGLIALIVLLWCFQDQPLQKWPYHHFMLNGAVALLATVIKTGLMLPVSAAIGQRKWQRFQTRRPVDEPLLDKKTLRDFETFDEASRGAFGCAKVIFRTGAYDVACIGAVLTILSVVFSTLTQNVLTTGVYVMAGTPWNLTAGSPPRVQNYGGMGLSHSVLELGNPQSDLLAEMAVYVGSLSTSVQVLPIRCDTGNCSWPTTTTLGVCSACMDATPLIEETFENLPCRNHAPAVPDEFATYTGCNVSIPNGSWLSVFWWEPGGWMSVFGVGNGSGAIFEGLAKNGSAYPSIPLISVDFIGVPYTRWLQIVAAQASSNSTPNDLLRLVYANVRATECGLWLCIKRLNIYASEGVFMEYEEDDHWDQAKLNGSMWAPGAAYSFTDVPDSLSGPNSDSYAVTAQASMDIMRSLESTILSAGIITVSIEKDAVFPGTQVQSQAIWLATDDLDSYMSNISTTLTNTMRLAGAVDTDSQDLESDMPAVAWTTVVQYEVRWLWLTFPFALVLLSIAFLIVTMIKDARSSVELRKNSASAVLRTSVDAGDEQDLRQNVGATGAQTEQSGRGIRRWRARTKA
ncbi:hypothetical protein LTR36_000242 [Oleoguttula mirabilis]|uniref:Uncharacterized protein n=1 Tax=Oleoguttula mirabilis TaxID=1507867 RepID=A0AAV9JY01_9PEZI|nr:hypothetical protein LTR36_000242 [Oleoguttula mirabilis]